MEKCAKNKLVISSLIHDSFGIGFYDVVKNDIWLINDKLSCRGFNIQEFIRIDLKPSLRMYGYLSSKAMQVVNQLEVMGIRIKFEKLKSSLRQIDVSGSLQIQPMGKLRDPGKIQVWSLIGVITLFGVTLALILLFIYLMQWLVSFQERLSYNGCIRYVMHLCFKVQTKITEFVYFG